MEEIPAPVVTYDPSCASTWAGRRSRSGTRRPAHTDGDSVVYFEKAKVLHMGDLFFHKVVPFIDVKSGGSPADT